MRLAHRLIFYRLYDLVSSVPAVSNDQPSTLPRHRTFRSPMTIYSPCKPGKNQDTTNGHIH